MDTSIGVSQCREMLKMLSGKLGVDAALSIGLMELTVQIIGV
jgi:hypothetical protein